MFIAKEHPEFTIEAFKDRGFLIDNHFFMSKKFDQFELSVNHFTWEVFITPEFSSEDIDIPNIKTLEQLDQLIKMFKPQ